MLSLRSPKRKRTLRLVRGRADHRAFGSTAGSAVCTAPALRTWIVAMSSAYTFASHRCDRAAWSRRFACASGSLRSCIPPAAGTDFSAPSIRWRRCGRQRIFRRRVRCSPICFASGASSARISPAQRHAEHSQEQDDAQRRQFDAAKQREPDSQEQADLERINAAEIRRPPFQDRRQCAAELDDFLRRQQRIPAIRAPRHNSW
jgi:hypothetical protein